MQNKKHKTIAEVAKDLNLTTFTIKRWQKQELIKIDKKYSARFKTRIRLYDEKDVDRLKWLKLMSGSHRSNEFYLKLLLEYIDTGKIPPAKLRWPLKRV